MIYLLNATKSSSINNSKKQINWQNGSNGSKLEIRNRFLDHTQDVPELRVEQVPDMKIKRINQHYLSPRMLP